MKFIKISNGESRKGYELKDLTNDVRNEVIQTQKEFLESQPIECENEDGEMQDEYQEYDEAGVIENIEVNGYLYDEDGEILPLLYYVGNHPEAGKIMFNKKYECEITPA